VTAPAGSLVVRPVTGSDWEDVTAVFGTRGDPATCWCQWFRLTPGQWREWRAAAGRPARAGAHREALRAEVTEGVPCAGGDHDGGRGGRGGCHGDSGRVAPGVLARLDGEPVGWCAAGPRRGYPRLTGSAKVRAVGDDLDDPDIWSVTCFVVRTGFRRRGLSGELLDGAVALAREQGARTVEAYPVDLAVTSSVSASELYVGALTTFLSAGFTEVLRTSPARPVVRLGLR
jgi:GNAT superfamily N-acetyltransferase